MRSFKTFQDLHVSCVCCFMWPVVFFEGRSISFLVNQESGFKVKVGWHFQIVCSLVVFKKTDSVVLIKSRVMFFKYVLQDHAADSHNRIK